MPETGVAHRAMKEQITNLSEKVDSTIALFDGKFKEIEGRLEKVFIELTTKIGELIIKLDSKPAAVSEATTHVCEKKFDELQDSILKIRHIVNEKIAVNNKKMLFRINFLERRLIDIERDITLNNQNSSKNNFEIDGIPAAISHEDLEGKVITILNSLPDSNFKKEDIEACHRISMNSNSTIL